MTLRADTLCPIFGNYGPLPDNVLLTYSNVIKCFLHKRHEKKIISGKDPSAVDISKEISQEITDIWKKALNINRSTENSKTV